MPASTSCSSCSAGCSCRASCCHLCSRRSRTSLPLSYAVDTATKDVCICAGHASEVAELGVIALWIVGLLALGSLTLRRRTP